ncbi:MAG: hypothetical protein QHH14_14025 [Clostridiales bacterium]|nr:hypothetical protein [Clostridiales bacterium]
MLNRFMIWFLCLSLAIVIVGCGKSEQRPDSESAQAPLPKKPALTIDKASLQQEQFVFEREESFEDFELKDTRFEEALSEGWPQEKMMSIDGEGYRVLGGLRDDPTRYQFKGEVSGKVFRKNRQEVLATYKFHVIKIIAGTTERLADAYLVCKGTYWLPVPVPKLDLPWENIPPTYATYEVPKTELGILLRAEEVISKGILKENGLEIDKDLDTFFVLTGNFEAAIFGKDSIHLPVSQPTQAQKDVSQVEETTSLPPAKEAIEKLIAEKCVQDRPSLQGYVPLISIKEVKPDEQARLTYKVFASVAFEYSGTLLELDYIDYFLIHQDDNGVWRTEIVKKK